uniref:hypothetical protein n=1 Tax=Escherichia coli TaxID=562 RepID=UPI001F293706|nr:hypothetical protein [Escherichia coli]
MSQSLLIKKEATVRWLNKGYWTWLAFFSRVLVVINAGNNDGSGRECSETAVEYWSGDIDEHIAQVINAEEKYADNDDKANRFAVEQFHQELSFWGEMTPALHHIRCQFFSVTGLFLTRKKDTSGRQ